MHILFFSFCGKKNHTIKEWQLGCLGHNSLKFVKLSQEAEHRVAKEGRVKTEWENMSTVKEMHIATRLVWETRSAPMSFFFLPWTTLLPSVCIGRKETDEGFTVGSWLVHIPGVVFLPSAPWPYQRPLKQQAVRLWQLASNSSYSSLAPRFPASLSSWVYVCVCVRVCADKCVSECFCM